MMERDLVQLLLTVYNHTDASDTKGLAMDLFERLLLLGSRSAYRALDDWDGKAYPVLRASVRKGGLGRVEQEAIAEETIRIQKRKLREIAREDRPVKWARLVARLATAYRERIKGDQAENIERAIAYYQQALEVLTREEGQVDWAMAQVNLATAYRERIRGDRAENTERAIAYYQQALEVLTRKENPVDWAMAQINLATAYRERIRGDRAENIERTIAHYGQALEVYTREDFPDEWAMTLFNLGMAYRERLRGERVENIERAIAHYQQALVAYTREDFPDEWAMILFNLGMAYRERIRGDRAENIERAIAHYEQALKVYTREDFSDKWAMTLFNLAMARRERLWGDRGQNIERAIAHYEQALKVYTREGSPVEWAMIQNNLASAYSERIRGERAENIERAIEHHTRALEVYTRQAFPAEWAMIQNNLASAYSERLRGERAENIERAIGHYTAALEVRTRQAFPSDWAMIQNNLATAYYSRVRGDRIGNLKQTLLYLHRALEVYSREVFPDQYAAVTQQLEKAQRELSRAEFFALWNTIRVEDTNHRVRQFCGLFAKLATLPLKKYHALSSEGAYLGIFDLTAVFQDLPLPFSDEFPILFLATKGLSGDRLDRIRRSLSDHLGPTNRRAILIPFCDDQSLAAIRELVSKTMEQAHAYDVICLPRKDLEQIVASTEPITELRRTILSRVDLSRISVYNSTGATPDNMFFGRERELQEICDQAMSANFVLIGGRRIGKTSILKQLEHIRLPGIGFYAFYHECGYTPTQAALVQALATDKAWFPEPPPRAPSSLAEVIQALPDNKPLVILLDEADKLIGPDQNAGYPIFNTLHALSVANRCRFILCGERALRAELTNPNSPLYNFGKEMLIGRLERHAVAELVIRPMKQLEITLADEATMVQRIWEFTSGHPSIVQSLCQRLITCLNQRDDRHLILDDVKAIVADPDFLRKDFLNIYWERATVLERLCSLVMAADDSVRTLTAVHEALSSRGIEVTLNQVDDALERLVDLRNIVQRTTKGYEFAVTAFPEVIAKTHRLDDLIALDGERYREHGDVSPRSKRGAP